MDGDVYYNNQIDKLIFILAKLYESNGEGDFHSLLAKVKPSIVFSHHDNWNGGIDFYIVKLNMPVKMYLSVDKVHVRERLLIDIKALNTPDYDFISDIQFDVIEEEIDKEWREHSGLLDNTDPNSKNIDYSIMADVWEKEYFRLFISHRTTRCKEASLLSASLNHYGITSFVAPDQIKPTDAWLSKMEAAIFSSDAIIGLISSDFTESLWTDQELGIAYGRNIPILTVNMGIDPYGFIGKYQAMRYEESPLEFKLARAVYYVLKSISTITDKMQSALANSLKNSSSYEEAKSRMELLLEYDSISEKSREIIERAQKDNSQVRDCYFVNSTMELIKYKARQ